MKLHLAPIQGITIAKYRTEYHKIFGGIDTFYAPFIATTQKRELSSNTFKDLFPKVNDDTFLVPQLLGNNGEDFNFYADQITALGYNQINWNIGCPSPTVTMKKKGSGILSHAEIVEVFLERVCKNLNYQLTVKMRLGYESLEEGKRIIEKLNAYPVSNVIIHARNGLQMYEGLVDVEAFSELYHSCEHDVTYNGDIYTLEDYQRIAEKFPELEHYMLGRGALRNPFLPSEIKGINSSEAERRDKLNNFHDEIFEYYKLVLSGEKHVLDKMAGFWEYTADYLDASGELYKKIKKCKGIVAYKALVNGILNK